MLPLQLSKKITQDARHFQLLALGSFLTLGILTMGWQVHLYKYLLIFTSVLGFQLLFSKLYKQPLDSLKSGGITAFGLCLLFYTSQPWLYVVAAFIAIASKYVLQYKGKHFYNPANIGIVLTYLLFGNSWISPGQWGSSVLLLIVLSGAGLVVLYRVQRLDIGLIFLVAYLGLEFCRNIVYKGWPMDFFVHQSCNGALLLFSFFMITDPCSTPNSKAGRVLFALLVAGLAFYLSSYKFVNGAPVWALFVVSPLTLGIDALLRGVRFEWRSVAVA